MALRDSEGRNLNRESESDGGDGGAKSPDGTVKRIHNGNTTPLHSNNLCKLILQSYIQLTPAYRI